VYGIEASTEVEATYGYEAALQALLEERAAEGKE
jgi:hypothetical protein